MAKDKTKKATTKKAAKPEPEVEPEEVEADDVELDELEEDEVEETAPAKGGKAKAKKTTSAQTVTFGASDLAKYINEHHLAEGAKPVDARGIRTLIRKMARDGSGRVNREIVPGNRTRYDWSGPNDPEVKKIIKAFTDGELEADKQEKLQALKDNKAKKDAEAEKSDKGGNKKKKAAAPAAVVEEEDDDDDADGDLELDDDE